MPYKKITSGKDKGKYRSNKGTVLTKDQMRAYHAKKKGKK